MPCELATARLPFHVDVNIGDPITPAPEVVVIPRLLGGQISLLGYPLVMVLAEKIVTAAARGLANTRWRDFYDIHQLSGTHDVSASELRGSIQAVATHRNISLRPLREVLAGYASTAQSRWATWLSKQNLAGQAPSDFAELIEAVAGFVDPILDLEASPQRWQHQKREWTT